MAKLDLISAEWTNLVFEGRNQDYGAYQLRKDTSKRNIWSIIIVALAAVLLYLGLTLHRMAEANRTVENTQAIQLANLEFRSHCQFPIRSSLMNFFSNSSEVHTSTRHFPQSS